MPAMKTARALKEGDKIRIGGTVYRVNANYRHDSGNTRLNVTSLEPYSRFPETLVLTNMLPVQIEE